MLMPHHEAEFIIQPYQNILADCVVSGFQDYLSTLKTLLHPIESRTTATLIHDYIVAHARNKLGGINGITLLTHEGLFIIVVQDKLTVKFKKLNSDKMPSNIPTNQTMDFMYQNFDLPNMQPHTNIIFGYELDPSQTRLTEITVTCPNGKTNLWSFNVNEDGSSQAIVLELPLPISPEIPMKVREDKKREREQKKRRSNE